MEEERLEGGVGNAGKVFKVGDSVRRPTNENSAGVHQLLAHLERVGFYGAPRVLGFDELGREMLSWIPGTTYKKGPGGTSPIVPEVQLASLGYLIRSFHDAVASFVPTPDVTFAGHEPVGFEAPTITHRDLCLENVVFRDGAAVALIDFDFAGRADPIWDVAIAVRHFVPIADPRDICAERFTAEDAAARLKILAAAYGFDDARLPQLMSAVGTYLTRGHLGLRARVEAGEPAFAELWAQGLGDRLVRAREWLEASGDRIFSSAF